MRAAAFLLALLAPLAVAGPAEAFPELMMRAGNTRCNDCHVSPGGGGLINDWGRSEAGDVLSRGGDGQLLHGAVEAPTWLLLGGDFRAAALIYDDVDATEGFKWAAFPMQADLRGGFISGPITVVATAGLRASARTYDEQDAPVWSYFVSPEHYVMWRNEAVGPYVRAGRFFPVQGLRLPDHTLYVRRYTGTNLYEEPYTLAAGYVSDTWELHAAGFVHDPLLDVGRRELGGAVHVERHVETWGVGLSARVGTGDDGLRIIGGTSARLRLSSDIVGLAEVDVVHDRIADTTSVTQLVGLAGADMRITQGVQVFGWYEQFQESLGLAGAAHHAVGAALKVYPRAHWELILHTRWQVIGDNVTGLGMFQLHYYL